MVVLIEDTKHFCWNDSRLGEDRRRMWLCYLKTDNTLVVMRADWEKTGNTCYCTILKRFRNFPWSNSYCKIQLYLYEIIWRVRKQNFQTGAFYEFVNMPFLKWQCTVRSGSEVKNWRIIVFFSKWSYCIYGPVYIHTKA